MYGRYQGANTQTTRGILGPQTCLVPVKYLLNTCYLPYERRVFVVYQPNAGCRSLTIWRVLVTGRFPPNATARQNLYIFTIVNRPAKP